MQTVMADSELTGQKFRRLSDTDVSSETGDSPVRPTPAPGGSGAYGDSGHYGSKITFMRNLLAFWFFGLTNNYGYVIMLSAAEDILSAQEGQPTDALNQTCNVTSDDRICETLSTGAVLLADILPTLIVKCTAPFYMDRIPFGIRIFLVVTFNIASYLIVAFSVNVPMSLAGVCCASFASGLGEITFLSLSAYYNKNVISTWSSGTGGAGVLGALVYAALRQANVSAQDTILIQLMVPVVMAFFYWVVHAIPSSVFQISLTRPSTWLVPKDWIRFHASTTRAAVYQPLPEDDNDSFDEYSELLDTDLHSTTGAPLRGSDEITLKKKVILILPLLKFMIPLGLVYVGEYFINQGLQQLIYFCDIWLSRKDQYRWYQVIYQIGVLISRSSANVVRIRGFFFYLLPVLQFANVAVFFTEAYFFYMPSIWIIFVMILFEGLLGGSSYVNTFMQIKEQVEPKYAEYSLGIASVADSSGIVISGFVSIPIHNWICKQSLPFGHR